MTDDRINKYQAAILLIDMISALRVTNSDTPEYHEAIVLACAELMAAHEREGDAE